MSDDMIIEFQKALESFAKNLSDHHIKQETNMECIKLKEDYLRLINEIKELQKNPHNDDEINKKNDELLKLKSMFHTKFHNFNYLS